MFVLAVLGCSPNPSNGDPIDTTYAIGDTGPAGGLVFYDKGAVSDGWRYLEAAPSDQSTGVRWYNGSYIDVATANVLGSGEADTVAIVSAQGVGAYAASICADLAIGGFDDWFLPSIAELDLVYTNLYLAGLGAFSASTYWTSSDYGAEAWYKFFNGGATGAKDKQLQCHVRAVRAF